MNCFITGTDTGIGKTLASSWLCLHLGYAYFKPIQTGSIEGTDRQTVATLSQAKTFEETYLLKTPASPHLAAKIEATHIAINTINLPQTERLIIEGAGGLLVPLNEKALMIDLIQHFQTPVILVSSTRLGTINHTLLSIEALKKRSIPLLGVILSGPTHLSNKQAIEYYGATKVLAHLPLLKKISFKELAQIPLPTTLTQIFSTTKHELKHAQ